MLLVSALLMFFGEGPVVTVPEAIVHIADMDLLDDRFYVLDAQEGVLVTIDEGGNLLAEYGAKGQGPGEWIRPGEICEHDRKLYISDMKSGKIIVLDEDLKFVSEFYGPPRPRDVLALKEGLFIASYEPAVHKLIRVFSHDFKPLHSFGTPLEPKEDMFGFQAAVPAVHGSRIYVGHVFSPRIEVWNRSGKLLKTLYLPGRDGDAMLEDIDVTKLNWWNNITTRMVSFGCGEDGRLYVGHYNGKEKNPLHVYDPERDAWTLHHKFGYFRMAKGHMFRTGRDKESDLVWFKRVDLPQ